MRDEPTQSENERSQKEIDQGEPFAHKGDFLSAKLR